MLSWYTVLKLVHVLSVIVWIGAVLTATGITSFVVAARDRATLAAWLPYSVRYGQRFAGPASILVLLSGIAMVIVAGIGFKPLWVSLGFAGIILHIAFGVVVLRTQGARMVEALKSADDARIAAAGRRMVTGNSVYLVLMASVVAVMVMKPTV